MLDSVEFRELQGLDFRHTSPSAMIPHLLKAIQFLSRLVVFVLGIGYLIHWARTRFWLPPYVHGMAALAAFIGICFAWPLPGLGSAQSPLAFRLLLPLLCPAVVYLLFVFLGGQAEISGSRPRSVSEIIALIEELIESQARPDRISPGDWHDFIGSVQPDKLLESYRRKCAELSPKACSLPPQNAGALDELRRLADELRIHSPRH